MPAPSVRSRIAGVGSLLDFASKRKEPIAVIAATFVLMGGFAAASSDGNGWACAASPHPAESGNIEAAKDTWDEFDSCKKTVETAEKRAAKYHLREKLPDLRDAEPDLRDAEPALRDVEAYLRDVERDVEPYLRDVGDAPEP
jgi:hypothetical protein